MSCRQNVTGADHFFFTFAGYADRSPQISKDGAVVVGVLVTYEPDPATLGVLLKALRPQLEKLIVIDNGSSFDTESNIHPELRSDAWCQVVRLHSNLGIASAQNVGIGLARQAGAAFVMLFDQDSEPAPDMVSILLDVATAKSSIGVAVAAIGPRYTDKRQDNPPPFIRIRGVSVQRQTCGNAHSVVEVDYLIASGSLIPMSTLDAVGGMREDLFIDYVDIEWGMRAKQAGFQSFGVCGARMQHGLGDDPINIFGRRVSSHSPLRHYYHFRNAIRLYCETGMPWNWKIADGWRLLLKYGAYTLFARPRHQHWWMMSRGIVHGLTGRMGKFDES